MIRDLVLEVVLVRVHARGAVAVVDRGAGAEGESFTFNASTFGGSFHFQGPYA